MNFGVACETSWVPLSTQIQRFGTQPMPLSLGGMGLRNAIQTSPAAFWASWADCFSTAEHDTPRLPRFSAGWETPWFLPHTGGSQTVASQWVGVEKLRDVLFLGHNVSGHFQKCQMFFSGHKNFVLDFFRRSRAHHVQICS